MMGNAKMILRLVALLCLLPWLRAGAAEKQQGVIPVVVAPQAASLERSAAGELAAYLARLYPVSRFDTAQRIPESGDVIVIGSAESNPWLAARAHPLPTAPEGFRVGMVSEGQRRIGVIVGWGPSGVVHGVYRLLERLGYGFYLSGDTQPAPREDAFSFDGWDLEDHPILPERFVFNWHNFLSGCSTWNEQDWRSWTLQAQKMGYNGIMVHAYGNNPMFSFRFNGHAKPTGFLSTTVKGRDWSTQHVNDVRRLCGGFVFDAPIFGPDAGLVPDDQAVDAARGLMQTAFEYARQRGMHIRFALDVDTDSANPQDLIMTLPAEARFSRRGTGRDASDKPFWLANPDTPQGYRYYKAQTDELLRVYPQINTLVVWFRRHKTPWMALEATDLPVAWQEEFRRAVEDNPALSDLYMPHNIFAISRIVRGMRRALDESGHHHVALAAGSWGFEFCAAADVFMPQEVSLIPLDYEVLHDKSQFHTLDDRESMIAAGSPRKLLPVFWAHHDDGNYVGRPYTPFPNFCDKLESGKAAGFGIIHWMTRPLDLYFKSLSDQVWAASRNRSLGDTIARMAEDLFRPAAGEMSAYLHAWIHDAPNFGRETLDTFLDRELIDVSAVIAAAEQRLALMDNVNETELSPEQRNHLNYFRGLERYIIAVHRADAAYRGSLRLQESGDLAAARSRITECDPCAVIEEYARTAALSAITRGDQGLIVSMNTRWLSHVQQLRQSLGLEPVRYNFAPTSHDPLAQLPGPFTFHFGAQGEMWECLGQHETGADIFFLEDGVLDLSALDLPDGYGEVCRSGIESLQPVTVRLPPVLGRSSRFPALLAPGKYALQLLLVDPEATEAGQNVMEVSVLLSHPGPEAPSRVMSERIDVFAETGRRGRPLVRTLGLDLQMAGYPVLELVPVQGRARASGIVIRPSTPGE